MRKFRLPTVFIFMLLSSVNPLLPRECHNNAVDSTADNCGVFKKPKLSKIFGGTASSELHWPWLVFIKITKGYNEEICTGSFISSNWIISAAHCFRYVMNYNRIIVIHGLRTNIRVINPKHAKFYRVIDIHYHPKSRSHGGIELNDVALLHVELVQRSRKSTRKESYFYPFVHINQRSSESSEFQNIMPVCVEDVVVGNFSSDSLCYVAGYGKVDENPDHWNYALNHAPMKLVPLDQCIKANSMIPEMQNGDGSETYFCAGSLYEHDSCAGDSGGPLMCRKPNSCLWTIIGIVSFGPKPCGSGYGVYSNLTESAEFISNVTNIFINTTAEVLMPTVVPSVVSPDDNLCCQNITVLSPAMGSGMYYRVINGSSNEYLV